MPTFPFTLTTAAAAASVSVALPTLRFADHVGSPGEGEGRLVLPLEVPVDAWRQVAAVVDRRRRYAPRPP